MPHLSLPAGPNCLRDGLTLRFATRPGTLAMFRYGFAFVIAAIVIGVSLPSWGQDSVPMGRIQPHQGTAAEAGETAESDEKPVKPLTIGDVAPALDVSDWVQDGGGKWEHVTKFKPGNVYIVEFWATWCGPCVVAMPHVSELQEKYADKGVQVISVSTEPVETVTEFLEKTASGEERTYAEITANYCLTTDPDNSVHKDYMEAAGQNGIPCAFLVGKDGKIEWIGHPMAIDEPLAQVVEGTWDREAFRAKFEAEQKLEREMNGIMRLASAGDLEGANAKLDALAEELGDAASESIAQARAQIQLFAFQAAVAGGNESAVEMLPKLIEALGGEPNAVGHVVSMVVRHAVGGGKVSDELRKASIVAVEGALENDPGRFEGPLMMLIARLEENGGDKAAAIAWMEKAVAAASEGSRERQMLDSYLKELTGEGAETDEDATDAEAAEAEAADEAK
jgi:thiol-disulfide isomerase/thioredoxin